MIYTCIALDFDYTYFPITSDIIKFKVKAKANSGPHICLSTTPFYGSKSYIEVVISLPPSSTSELRIRDSKTLVRHNTATRENILNESELRGFWISFKNGVSIVHVGQYKFKYFFPYSIALQIWM